MFLGGGFGSFDFYAFDASSGVLDWQYQTSDDGPTAAVVEEDCVVFNTESCELEVLTIEGVPIWKKWLGDPLMSMPAVRDGRVYMAYPDAKGDRRHHIACFDLRTGREYWKQPIEGEIITAPVMAEGFAHFATLGGTLYRVNQENGEVQCQEPRNATSSPVVWAGQCYFSQREQLSAAPGSAGEAQQSEHLGAYCLADQVFRHYAATSRKADYLDHAKRAARSPQYSASAEYDSAVGFGGVKGDSKMHQAVSNLGRGHVHAVWAYQGSKPFVSREALCGSRRHRQRGRSPLRSRLLEEDHRSDAWRRQGAARPSAHSSGHRQRQAILRLRSRRRSLHLGGIR